MFGGYAEISQNTKHKSQKIGKLDFVKLKNLNSLKDAIF